MTDIDLTVAYVRTTLVCWREWEEAYRAKEDQRAVGTDHPAIVRVNAALDALIAQGVTDEAISDRQMEIDAEREEDGSW